MLDEANTHVTHLHLNLSGPSVQVYSEVPHAAVFQRILQGFLQDSIQAKGEFFRQVAGDIFMGEVKEYDRCTDCYRCSNRRSQSPV